MLISGKINENSDLDHERVEKLYLIVSFYSHINAQFLRSPAGRQTNQQIWVKSNAFC